MWVFICWLCSASFACKWWRFKILLFKHLYITRTTKTYCFIVYCTKQIITLKHDWQNHLLQMIENQTLSGLPNISNNKHSKCRQSYGYLDHKIMSLLQATKKLYTAYKHMITQILHQTLHINSRSVLKLQQWRHSIVRKFFEVTSPWQQT